MSIEINEGTQTTVNTTLVGGTETQVVRIDIGSGTTAGAFTGNIPSGTITRLEGGTLASITNLVAGTITGFTPTVNVREPRITSDAFSTVVFSGTSTLGTIRAGTAGTTIQITDLIISAGSATNVEIGNGGTANMLVGTLFLSANGGAVMAFKTPLITTAGSSLVYKQSTNGPLTITCAGFLST